jgi:ketosteroid isomerase-like protein
MIRNATDFRFCRLAYRCSSLLFVLGLCLALSTAALAQKKKKDATPPPPATTDSRLALPDEQKIDYLIGEMLGAWQLGDTEKLHETIADDISVVSGNWAPPVVGWANYLAAYQVQRARAQQIRMDRSNTYIRISASETVAWSCYQWDFSAVVDGQPSAARGQTTLVLEKRDDKWLIVHNHTSIVQSSQPAGPASVSPQPTPTPKP